MQTKSWPRAIPPSRAIQVPRHPRHVTHTSLFAFDSRLCPNRQVTGAGLGSTADSGLDHQGEADPGGTTAAGGSAADAGTPAGEAAAESAEPAGSDGIAVTSEISLAVAAKASGENFPVALRVLPRSVRAHLSAFYGFARLGDDIGDGPLPAL